MASAEEATGPASSSGAHEEVTAGAPTLGLLLGLPAMSGQDLLALKAHLQQLAVNFVPSICRRDNIDVLILQDQGISLAEWTSSGRTTGRGHTRPSGYSGQRPKAMMARPGHFDGNMSMGRGPMPKLSRAIKSKANGSGRTYTSRYRGVHQTFPTRRWEAQFRRNGKPTSLGCFDHESEAARAYDKMMLWCELHHTTTVKGGITNFDATEYEKDIPWLQGISQDELIDTLRGEGRRQAAQRMKAHKRSDTGGPSGTEDSDDGELDMMDGDMDHDGDGTASAAGGDMDLMD